ncbi:Ankyrin [Trichoderma cornu-damae]|uniref:Ankyrin n=1 Tax=Trichoderma cornu-damae TaxID=654480 RepID=A0A9P8TXD9_9HYPO|nr:Ankyrin [Trichoderma cornu-damae]
MGLRQANKSGFPAHDEDAEDTDAVFISRDDISDYNPGQILPEPPDVVEEIRAWLQPTAYDIAGGEYRKHLSSHVAGTGNWLTSTESYQKWLGSDEHGLLWITGIPGSGKSVMAAKLIDELAKSNPGSAVLFFFFRQIIDANHKPQALLRDWMDQILSHSPPLQKQLKAHVDDRRSLESVSMEDMWKHLRLALACLPGKVFCVADALDEMDQGHEEFLKALAELGRWRPKTVKVLITSRTVPSVEGPLRKSPCLRIRLQETLVDMDISTYVHHALSRSNIPRGDWHVIADAVPGRANGLFLYAKLAMDAFLEPGVDIRTALSRLPTDLNALYTDLLDEHAKRSGVPESIQRLILQSVTHATRPLRLLELAEMIRVGRPDGATRDIKATKNVIRAACGPLLEILPDETVSVIHHSFTEYLKGMTRSGDSPHMGYPVLQAGPTHARLASQCLLYLQAGCLGSVKIGSSGDGHGRSYDDYEIPEQEVQLRLRYPFFEYAASNWHRHIAKSEAAGHDQAGTNAKLHEVFGDGKNRDAWLQMRWPVKAAGNRLVTQLHIAAKTGLISYAKELLKSIDANTRDEYDRTPVWWAAAGGNAEVIDALIEAGADPDQPDNLSGVRPLHNAASGNHSAAVTALLKAGVDPLTPKTLEDPGIRCGNAPSTVGDSPLMYASSGHIEALEAFLPFIGDDIALVHRALAWAASAGSTKAATRLLRHPGVNVDAVVDGQTPLYRACSTVDADMVAVFLRAGADPNIRCDVSGGRALPWTSEEEEDPSKLNCLYELCNNSGDDGCDEKLEIILPLLIQAGIDIHYRTPSGESALHAATRSPVLVRLLLEAGLDANATDCHGAAALHRLDASGDSAMLSMALLVEQGHADINAANADGQTPLRCLLSSCNSECILRFLEYGPDCNARDNNGNNALHVVMQHNGSNLEVINALLKRGADPNARNHEQLVPLLYLTQADRNFTGIVQAFVEAGADIHAADRDGNTLFFRLLSGYTYLRETESHSELKYLVDRGHSPSQRNFHGHTALHLAVKHHSSSEAYGGPWNLNMSRLDFLISLNLDVKAVDYGGNSLLHVLAMRRDNHYSFDGVRLIALWEKLLALGLNLEQKNHSGRTPLHILCTARTRSLRLEPGSVMPIDFVLSRVKNVDLPDVDGITPLHIAVTRGELYAKKLIDAGANPLVHTYEGLTPLHLAARCRDGNAVGLLLGALRRHREGRKLWHYCLKLGLMSRSETSSTLVLISRQNASFGNCLVHQKMVKNVYYINFL